MSLFSVLMFAQPTLTKKSLETSPVVSNLIISTAAGSKNMIRQSGFVQTGNYTVEVKAKIGATNSRGLDIEAQDAARKGFRYSIGANGLFDFNDASTPATINGTTNSDDFHTFRYAVEGTNVHIYRDKVFLSTKAINNPLTKEDVMVEMDGGFETTNALTNWTGSQTLVTSDFHSGAKSVQLISTDQTTRFASYTINGLKPGAEYALSFWTKYLVKSVNAADLRYDIQFGYYVGATFNVVNADILSAVTALPVTSMIAVDAIWTQVSRSFVVPINATVAIIRFAGKTGTATYLVDDFSLIQGKDIITPVGSNIAANSGFETWTLAAYPDGWLQNNLANSRVTTTKETTVVNGGSFALKLTTPAAATAGAAYNGGVLQTLPDVPSQYDRYTLSFDAQNDHPDVDNSGAQYAMVTFQELNSATPVVTTFTTYVIPTSTTFKTYTLTYDVKTADCTSFKVGFFIRNIKTGWTKYTLYLDNVTLTKQTSSYTNFLDYGKAAFFPAADLNIEYLNYDLTGAYAPDGTTLVNNSGVENIHVISKDGNLHIINAPQLSQILVFATDGRIVYKGSNPIISVNKGNYIVKIITAEKVENFRFTNI